MKLHILHTNDFHGSLDDERFQQLSQLRKNADLYFDTGDCIKAGNLAIPLKQDPAWTYLKDLACDASVLGNRETHVIESAFKAKMAGATHPILCANLKRKDGSKPLMDFIELKASDLTVGVFAVMVPMVTERMKTKAASVYLWDQPIPRAVEIAAQLRSKVDLVIALTHIGLTQDKKLAQATDDIDIILGGHSHDVLEQPLKEGTTWICQGGSHGRFAGEYVWDSDSKQLTGHLTALKA